MAITDHRAALRAGLDVDPRPSPDPGERLAAVLALLPDGRVVIHVSRLATHTRDMEEHAGVSLLVLDQPSADVPAQALARATLQGEAQRCAVDAPEYAQARQCYVARFAQSEDLFGFADFSLFVVRPQAVRFVGGFARAASLALDPYLQGL